MTDNRKYIPLNIQKFSDEIEAGKTIQVNGSATLNDVDTSKESRVLRILGQTSQTGTPTPSSPIPVNVVSGDNEISITGKNLLDLSSFVDYTSQGVTFSKENGIIKVTGTPTATSWNRRVNITLPAGTYTFSGVDNLNADGLRLTLYYSNSDSYSISKSDSSKTFTISEEKTYGLAIWVQSTADFPTGNVILTPMIEKGASKTTYEPYTGNTYNIDLPEGIELCKIGDYQDRIYKENGKWYLHKEIGKVVFTSATNWYYDTGGNRFATSVSGSKTENSRFPIISNYFRYISSGRENGGGFNYGGSIYLYNYDCTSVNELQTWLSTHNTIVYYVLATPTNTEITDTLLLSQLEALQST